jgi:hypothetical protein
MPDRINTVPKNDDKCDKHICNHFFVQTASRPGTTAGAPIPCRERSWGMLVSIEVTHLLKMLPSMPRGLQMVLRRSRWSFTLSTIAERNLPHSEAQYKTAIWICQVFSKETICHYFLALATTPGILLNKLLCLLQAFRKG